VIAAVSWIFGADVVWSGFLVSALASVLLAFAVYSLVLPFARSRMFSALCASFIVLFPVHLRDSLSYVPDALSTALTIWCLALLVRRRFLWAGVVFGCAWLCRSTAVFCLPGVLAYVLAKHGLRQGFRAVATFLVASAAVASPWLVHTARVWGSPFRSDGVYYLLQNYYACRMGHCDVERYWHSLSPPPPLSDVLRHDARGLMWFAARGIPRLLYGTLYGWSEASKPVAALLVTLLGLAALQWRRVVRTAEGIAVTVICTVTFGVLTLRADSLEIRYLGPCTALIFACAFAAVFPAARGGLGRLPRSQAVTAAAVLLPLFAAWPVQDWTLLRVLRVPRQETAELKAAFEEVNRNYARGQRVLVYRPYFYTLFTGTSALSIPEASRQELIDYMRRYRAPFLILEKPAARRLIPSLAPEFRETITLGGRVVIELLRVP
jgi:hypothetical protein